MSLLPNPFAFLLTSPPIPFSPYYFIFHFLTSRCWEFPRSWLCILFSSFDTISPGDLMCSQDNNFDLNGLLFLWCHFSICSEFHDPTLWLFGVYGLWSHTARVNVLVLTFTDCVSEASYLTSLCLAVLCSVAQSIPTLWNPHEFFNPFWVYFYTWCEDLKAEVPDMELKCWAQVIQGK